MQDNGVPPRRWRQRLPPAQRSAAAALVVLATTKTGTSLDAQESGWTRSVQVSANAWYGAARARIVATDVAVARTDSGLSLRSDIHAGYADDRDPGERRRVTARAVRASVSADYRPFGRYSPFGFAGVETNFQQRIARRYNVGVGAKLTLHRKGPDDLSVSLALLEERTRALALDRVRRLTARTRWSVRFRYRRQVTASVFFSHVTFYQPETRALAERYTVDSNTSIEAALTSVLALTGTLRHRYDSEAAARGADSNTDGQMLVGLRARF